MREEPAGFAKARAVADAVLFEGYILYPYRASAPKNMMRWQFGVLAPAGAAETCEAVTECVVVPHAAGAVTVRARFLQLRRRDARGPADPAWDEGVTHEIDGRLDLVPGGGARIPFTIPGGQDGERRWWPLSGVLHLSAEHVPGDLLKVTARLENTTPAPVQPQEQDHPQERESPRERGEPRERMLRRSFLGAHVLLSVTGGEFVSMIDPPEEAAAAVAACASRHTWPALIDATTLLSAPIIVGDHPQVAPESPGDMCDLTEIDELLVLRTMTLTDEEKRQARATDERAAAIVDGADAITPDALARLHGVVRPTEVVPPEAVGQAEGAVPWWSAEAERAVSPRTDSVQVCGGDAARGTRVRLRPRRRADAQDMFLEGRTATVAVVLADVDGGSHVAVTLDDDPAAALKESVGRYLYFAPDEVELL
ncbi:hypothetical protein [Actinomadura sp. 9N407]|uniref:hypothetical protein n=1 Tax=Actinomadura sp. 9N407 TaxID=3375154 RepID=UPI0037B184A4